MSEALKSTRHCPLCVSEIREQDKLNDLLSIPETPWLPFCSEHCAAEWGVREIREDWFTDDPELTAAGLLDLFDDGEDRGTAEQYLERIIELVRKKAFAEAAAQVMRMRDDAVTQHGPFAYAAALNDAACEIEAMR